ncbi:hypothetical protein GCM10027187_40590 [Streptosporangium sandarakinum]|uniref:Uncharacterized protein n=1 Tax=Streptosporangium sandarakinum TaxID=1260955 RepID=A0A852VE05_9ACTN|nr:hypothetical protein [Streptosporangium sandarakinum]NYF44611.1 hypothetical protein [Streptosporangium sandarakinum]
MAINHVNATTSSPVNGPTVITIDRAPRTGAVTPYVSTYTTDVDDYHYRPGGQRFTTASLLLPRRDHRHVMAVELRFEDPETVTDVIGWLTEIRDLLSQRLTADDFPEHSRRAGDSAEQPTA